MANKIRVVVAILLTLVSLTVLSLHVALCIHYPSRLFAVTLLLNPSLWLFLGMMTMFCTLAVNYRDKRRKLVPALCTTCRPNYEYSPKLWRYRHLRWQHKSQSSCRCTMRLLSNYPPPSTPTSVQTVVTQTGHDEVASSSLKLSVEDPEVHKSTVVELNENPREVQNYSCLSLSTTKPFISKDDDSSIQSSMQSTPSVRSSRHSAKLAYCSYSNKNCQLIAATNSFASSCNSSTSTSKEGYENLLLDANERIGATTSDSTNSKGAISKHIPTQPRSKANQSACTCPARYYINQYPTRSPQIKSKLMMKCSVINKKQTPVHLFQVKNNLKTPPEPKIIPNNVLVEEIESHTSNMPNDHVSFSSITNLLSN